MAAQTFADRIAPDVIAACINTGVFPSVVIAQAIEESGAGSSALARMFNNIFGHMASGSWNGKTGQTKPGGKIWRAYDSFADAITAHIQVLKRPAYRLAGAFAATTPYEQALSLQKGGYNKGPDREKYALKLATIIKQNHLDKYDQQLISQERMKNDNGLAYSQQSALTRNLHNLFNS